MNPMLISPLLELGGSIINRLFPDPEKKAQAEAELLKLTQDGELKKVLAQLEINAKEAAHPNMFVAGWRPFCGWVGGVGLLYATIGHNVLAWLAVAQGWPVPPTIDSDLLVYLLGGMLGIGGLRTVEKVKGVASK